MPAPPSRFFGHLRAFASDPLAFLDGLRLQYDEAARLRFINQESHIFIDPRAVKYILVDNHRNFDKDMYDYRMLRRVLGMGLVTNDGPSWLKQRRLIQPSFSRKTLGTHSKVMLRCIDEQVQEWNGKSGQKIDVAEEMMRVTLRIVGLALFSKDLLGEANAIGNELTRANRLVTRRIFAGYPPFVPGPLDLRLALSARRLRSGVLALIHERQAALAQGHSQQPDDLLHALLAARDEQGRGMSAQMLRDEVLTLLSAGHETTANTLAWTFHLLGENPREYARLKQALEVLPAEGPITPEQVGSVPYVYMVLKEAMRLRPAVWSVGRRVKADDVILGYRVRAGSIVFVSQYVTQRHPKFWQDPTSFDPERFSPQNEAQIPPYAFFPFGGGPRLCIGQDFSLLEAALILARLVRDFDLAPVDSRKVVPEALITMRPRNGVLMRLSRR